MRIILTNLFTTLQCQRKQSATIEFFSCRLFKKRAVGTRFAPKIALYLIGIGIFVTKNGELTDIQRRMAGLPKQD